MNVNYTNQEIINFFQKEREELFVRHINGNSVNKANSIDDMTFDIHALKGLGGAIGQYPCSIRGRYGKWHSVLALPESEELLDRAKQSFIPRDI